MYLTRGCGCKKSGCTNKRCKCKKNGNLSTPGCSCKNCENCNSNNLSTTSVNNKTVDEIGTATTTSVNSASEISMVQVFEHDLNDDIELSDGESEVEGTNNSDLEVEFYEDVEGNRGNIEGNNNMMTETQVISDSGSDESEDEIV